MMLLLVSAHHDEPPLPLTCLGIESFAGISCHSAAAMLIFLEIDRGLVPLAPLATSMVIESNCISLSQIQKELWPF